MKEVIAFIKTIIWIDDLDVQIVFFEVRRKAGTQKENDSEERAK